MASVIGTTDGLVLKRDGLILCGCCEEPECCMYPADRLWPPSESGPPPEGFFTFDDLPDELLARADPDAEMEIITKTIVDKGGGRFQLYLNLDDPDEKDLVFNEEGFPIDGASCAEGIEGVRYSLGPSFAVQGGCCLSRPINIGLLQDNFADCYEVTFLEFIATAPNTPQPVVRTVERDTLCTWRAVDRCGNRVVLRYDVTRNKFVIQRAVYFNTVGLDCNFNTRIDLVKTGSQKSPVGDYEEDASVAEC